MFGLVLAVLSSLQQLSDEVILYSPVAGGEIVSEFGLREDPMVKKKRFHPGIDIKAFKGEDIRAVGAGVVVFAGVYAGYGNLVTVRHARGITTHYGHCSVVLTKVGDVVSPGQVIAKVGQSGRATGNHLHFEIRFDGMPVDPVKVMKPLSAEG